MEIVVSIVLALIKAIFGAATDASAASSRSKAEAATHTTKSVIESYETERAIRGKTESVKHVDLDPTDIFGARYSPVQ